MLRELRTALPAVVAQRIGTADAFVAALVIDARPREPAWT
jgi:hypothetical protein